MRNLSLQSLFAALFSLLFFLEATNAAVCSDYFLYQIAGKGLAPNAASGYKTYRNVKDYGAKGDARSA